eukprot:INCI14379.1.p1 GENE.INCI14379.1~~INCI14379.1.p1  ORF type:complete len:903 (-),score=130.56 INCI14379.1:65-2773(-)
MPRIKVLSVAEKPSVAKQIALVMNRGQPPPRSNGPSPYNCNWKVKATILGNEECDMVVTSVTGHMMDLCFGAEYKSWQIDESLLFEAPVHKKVKEDAEKIAQNLKKEIRGCAALVLWLDCDDEGENIAQEVVDVCAPAARRGLRIYRARFSAVTSRDIDRALRNLDRLNEKVIAAVDTRTEIDLRLGAVFTRFQSGLLGGRFEDVGRVISYGPCQFPTLGFVAERYKLREAFVPREFWSIQVKHTQVPSEQDPREGEAEFLWARQRLFDRVVVFSIFEECVDYPQAEVKKVNAKEIRKWRPLPLQTVEFQKLASQKLRIDSSVAMDIAEKLYQQGLLSYPRTETDQFPKDFEFEPLIREQADHPDWGSYAERLLAGEFAVPRQGNRNDKAHPPIHPTKKAPNLQGDEKRIYELVTRYFLACCSNDAIGHQTVVEIDVADEMFSTRGLTITALNYLEVLRPFEQWRGRVIPEYHEGEVFLPTEINMTDGRTEPPALLTESALIAIMDREGIGTDATIASHIKKIQDRKYSEKRGQYFEPTKFGLALINGYCRIGRESGCLAKPYLRAHMESDCKAIIEGSKQADLVKSECLRDMRNVYNTVKAQEANLYSAVKEILTSAGAGSDFSNARPTVRCTCGVCQQPMVLKRSNEKQGRDNRYIYLFFCQRCNDSFKLPFFLKPPFADLPTKKCPTCRSTMLKGNSDRGEVEKCPRGCGNQNKRGSAPVMPCFSCNGSMVLMQSDRGFRLSCDCGRPCGTVVWFPKAVVQAEVTRQQCPECTAARVGGDEAKVFMLKFKFRRSSLMPGFPTTYTGCVRGHDDTLTDYNNLGFKIAKSRTGCTNQKCRGAGRRVQGGARGAPRGAQRHQRPAGNGNSGGSRMLSKPNAGRRPAPRSGRSNGRGRGRARQ